MVSHNKIIVGLGLLLSSCTMPEPKEVLAPENSDSNTSLVTYQSYESKNGMVSLLPTYILAKTGSEVAYDEVGLIGNIKLGTCVLLVGASEDQRTAIIFPQGKASRDDQGRLVYNNKTWEEGEEITFGALAFDYKPSDKNYKEIDVKEICDSQNFFFVVA